MKRLLLAVAAAMAIQVAAPAGAEEPAPARSEPLWEAGLGVAGLALPDYRGSDRSRGYVLPIPYFVYRGEVLRADRGGARAVFLETDRVHTTVSVGASLPVDSSRDPAREGMPDLRGAVEFGPSVEVSLWRAQHHAARLEARFPLRAAVTVESHPRFIGGEFFPHLNLDVRDPAGFAGWNLGLLAGPMFNDGRYNRYFYEVAPEFATPQRSAYRPSGGFAGMQYLAALSKRYPRYWVGAFARYDTLHGATFEDSPLVTSRRYAAAGIAISWVLGESAQRVPVNAFDERGKP